MSKQGSFIAPPLVLALTSCLSFLQWWTLTCNSNRLSVLLGFFGQCFKAAAEMVATTISLWGPVSPGMSITSCRLYWIIAPTPFTIMLLRFQYVFKFKPLVRALLFNSCFSSVSRDIYLAMHVMHGVAGAAVTVFSITLQFYFSILLFLW